LRHIYTNETIIAVDNSSLNNKWFKIAKSLNIIILSNNSELHRFEMGAYKLALQYYRSDKYIFIQGTIFFNKKLDLTSLNEPLPNATAFKLLHNDLSWSDKGLVLINSLLQSIQMKKME
jgi:protein involved in sex pheromone biosynthesis